MSPERHVSRGSRVQAITQKLKNRQNYERPASRLHTLKHRRTYSTNDLRERRDRFAHDRNDDRKGRSVQGRVVDDRTTDIPKRTISHVISRLVARSLLIGFWWLLLLLWWVLTLLPRCVVFVFVKEKRKHKEEVPAEKTSKKYKVSGQSKVNIRVSSLTAVMIVKGGGSDDSEG